MSEQVHTPDFGIQETIVNEDVVFGFKSWLEDDDRVLLFEMVVRLPDVENPVFFRERMNLKKGAENQSAADFLQRLVNTMANPQRAYDEYKALEAERAER